MDSRREFIKKASLLAGGAGLFNTLPASVQKAFSIDPVTGSTYLDAKHIVVLMQENRSFDHCFGTLQGVRGFNDPRVIRQPNGNKVWLQTNERGDTYAPFRLNIKETKSTWVGSLPHSWTDQVDARNNGHYDKWLVAKPSGNKAFATAPLTLGYYNREDIPFYYSLADAFTVCDQNFCSSLTGTTPNRLFLWSGTVRDPANADGHAKVRNEDVGYDSELQWKTFPERLEEQQISWKIYQNEISLDSGLDPEHDAWLANFTDNPIEWFSKYNVRYATTHRRYADSLIRTLPAQIDAMKRALAVAEDPDKAAKELETASKLLAKLREEQRVWSDKNFDKLSPSEKNLHTRAFTTNINDPHYRELEDVRYKDDGIERQLKLPKGDILHQFREDVTKGSLPSVSWIVAPENFSDHPGAPWYGAWYVSEVLDILTNKAEVWQNTILILCYDENDGYFDHVPPFVAPCPNPQSGLVSKGIDISAEHVTLEEDLKRKPASHARASAIGLGYRVPLVVASPWSRGGAVCSQVFDHTSIIQLIEKIFTQRNKRALRETNISEWRRVVCGDLSAVFRPYGGEKILLPETIKREPFMQAVHAAQFKRDPFGYHVLTSEEIEKVNTGSANPVVPQQEIGTRPACAIPYQLYGDFSYEKESGIIHLEVRAATAVFGKESSGAPFVVYPAGGAIRNYAVRAGDTITDGWPLSHFGEELYNLTLHGPNGFFREAAGNRNDPPMKLVFEYEAVRGKRPGLTGNVILTILNTDRKQRRVDLRDNAYKAADRLIYLDKKATTLLLDLSSSSGWYDFSVTVDGNEQYLRRYAGHVETGVISRTDPAMGREIV